MQPIETTHTAGHGSTSEQQRDQAIIALLSHSTVEEAARAVDISPNTLRRWLNQPEFDEPYREAKRLAFAHLRHPALRKTSSHWQRHLSSPRPAKVHNLDVPALVRRLNAKPKIRIEAGCFVTYLQDQRYVLGKTEAGIRPAVREALQLCRHN